MEPPPPPCTALDGDDVTDFCDDVIKRRVPRRLRRWQPLRSSASLRKPVRRRVDGRLGDAGFCDDVIENCVERRPRRERAIVTSPVSAMTSRRRVNRAGVGERMTSTAQLQQPTYNRHPRRYGISTSPLKRRETPGFLNATVLSGPHTA